MRKRLAVVSIVAAMAAATPAAVPGPAHAAKTVRQCKADARKCKKDCDKLIDIDTNVQDCKARCGDKAVLCFPTGSSSMSATGAAGSGGSNGSHHRIIRPVGVVGGKAMPHHHRHPVNVGGLRAPSAGLKQPGGGHFSGIILRRGAGPQMAHTHHGGLHR